MRRLQRGALVALLTAATTLVVWIAPAAAQTSGSETLTGVIVASGTSGQREVVSARIVATGAFNGGGQIIEIPSQPNDPENVNRDDLVFHDGTMHLISTLQSATFSVDPRTCIVTVTIEQTGVISGGTGRFATASGSFTGVATGHGLALRNPDRSCSEDQRINILNIDESGTLTF
jgi:hypothetical protein